MLQNIFISNECCYLLLIYNKEAWNGFHKNIKKHNCFSIDNI